MKFLLALGALLTHLVTGGQMWPFPGPGHASYVPPLDCTAATDFSATARHIYFWKDASWAVAGDVDDETSGTVRALSATAANQPSDANIITDTGLPSGTSTAATNGARIYYPWTGTQTAYFPTTAGAGLLLDAANADFTFCVWQNSQATSSRIWYYYRDGTHGEGFTQTNNGSVVDLGWNSNGTVLTVTSAYPVNVWNHLCFTVDNDGAGGGTDTRTIYMNGNVAATDSGPDDSLAPVGGQGDGYWGTTLSSKQHEITIFGSALTQAQICDITLCGIDKTANPNQRKAAYATSGYCSTHTPGS